jgi:hypothetical protein
MLIVINLIERLRFAYLLKNFEGISTPVHGTAFSLTTSTHYCVLMRYYCFVVELTKK